MKKWISYLFLIVLLIGSIPMREVEAAVDVTKPIFESLSVDKKDVKVGEEVTITVKANDAESGIKRVTVFYDVPQTDKLESLNMSYDSEKKAYVARLMMTEDKPSGVWKPSALYIGDNAGNEASFYSWKGAFNDLGEFNLNDYQNDKISPEFKSISLSQLFLDQAQPLEIKVSAVDDTKVKGVKVTYQHSPSQKEKIVMLAPSTELNEYQTSLQLTEDLDAGEWKISSVEVEDINGNKTLVTEGLNSYAFIVFERIKPLAKTFYTGNTSLSYRTISGDLYIGSKAIVTLTGTTVNGNIYVLGAMRVTGGVRVNGTIYANSFSYGSGSLYQGGVVMSGSNNVSSMTASNDPLNKKLPFEIYNEPLVKTDGKVTFSGATVPVVDVTVEGEKLNINSDGTFRVKDYPIGTKRQLNFVFRDIFGNTWTKSYNVLDRSKPVVTSSLSSGIYVEGEKIVLSATKGAKIHYTTDGTPPTASSPVFIDSIPIKDDMQVRYIAIDALGIHSDVGMQQFYVYSIEAFLEEASILKGSGTPGMSINVLKDGKSISETVINDSKRFELKLDQQKIGTRLTVVAELKGLKNKEYSFLVEDHTPPEIPVIDRVTNRSTTVTGQAEPGAIITMLIGETTVEFRTDASGRFSQPVSQLSAGTMISLRASDASNNQSEKVEQRVSDVIKPILSGVTNQTIALGQVFNPLYKVTANDETDGNVTSKIKTTGTVDSKRSGVYTITYTVIDRAGNLTKVNRLITVRDTVKPTISGVSNVTIGLNQKFDVRKNVSAKDNVDGTLTKVIKITGSINVNKVGTYNLTYSVSDKAGNKTTIIRKVTVKDLTKPVLSGVAAKTVKYKTSFNPMAGVSAKDNLDGLLTKKIKVSGTINTKKKGSYYLTYRVEDKAGNLTMVKRKITVK
ncbi:immunoglobulin-like domain-containing protein [Exiguobacterium sp. s145]|uniref:immunoglobulin-like domain-containing protein n=2 Tax=Exiguobacterium TaxID=33986 RepID=UPI001BEB93D0|nr:immunoglobulin-like domain-containing protein [Exiguobacterium sp. s145]